jgi:hypothetical protein
LAAEEGKSFTRLFTAVPSLLWHLKNEFVNEKKGKRIIKKEQIPLSEAVDYLTK